LDVRAIVKAERGNYERALRDVQEAIEPGHPSAFANQATILERMGRLREALTSLDLAVEQSGDAVVWARRGLLREAWRRRRKLEEGGRRSCWPMWRKGCGGLGSRAIQVGMLRSSWWDPECRFGCMGIRETKRLDTQRKWMSEKR
jgi:tetratricopeptide (TPR) repeat protein